MTLRGFHIVFIAVASLFLLWLATFTFQAWQQGHATSEIAVAVSAAVGGLGLAVYGVRFYLKTRQPLTPANAR